MAVDALERAVLPVHQRAQGEASITAKLRDGITRIDRLYQDGCAKLRFPNTHADNLEAVLINTAGGLTGGDDIAWNAHAAPGTRLVLSTQACERIYRSLGTAAHVRTRLSAGAGAQVDWLPQETILFQNSILCRQIDVELAAGASFLAVEAVLLGRDAMGEEARSASLQDNWRIYRNGRLIHAEATRLTDSGGERDGLSLLRGARAFATMIFIGAAAERKQGQLSALCAGGRRIGVSRTGERLIVRALAESGLALRRLIVPVIEVMTSAGTLPRVWHL